MTLKPTQVAKKRVGQPRVRWVETDLEALWKPIGQSVRPDPKVTKMNLDNQEHINCIRQAAQQNICEQRV